MDAKSLKISGPGSAEDGQLSEEIGYSGINDHGESISEGYSRITYWKCSEMSLFLLPWVVDKSYMRPYMKMQFKGRRGCRHPAGRRRPCPAKSARYVNARRNTKGIGPENLTAKPGAMFG